MLKTVRFAKRHLVFLLFLAFALALPSLAFAASGRAPTLPNVAAAASDAEANTALPGALTTAPSATNATSVASGEAYVLGVGDRIRLTVYGEADLSGEYEVSSTGVVALPLIGEIRAANGTLHAFESAVRAKLSEGYLHDPRVSVQVMNYRPFFILGEVSKPGSYPYVNGMNVLNAVALSGGYTYRADKSGVTILHANDPEKKERPISEDAQVAPGDIIRVPERFF